MKVLANQIEWHDARIIEMQLFSDEDTFNRFKIKLMSDVLLQDFGASEITVTISDCYKIRTDLNLWIEGVDSIMSASIQENSTWIDEEKNRLINGFGPKKLWHFLIITNSNSQIEALLTREDCFEVTL